MSSRKGWDASRALRRRDGGREKHSTTQGLPLQSSLCRLAFLAPDIQKRILEGRQPAEMTLDRLLHGRIPTSWADQRSLFGIAD